MTILIYICDRDQLIVLTNQYNSDAVIYVMIKEVNEDEFSFVLCERCRENVDQINFRSVWFPRFITCYADRILRWSWSRPLKVLVLSRP